MKLFSSENINTSVNLNEYKSQHFFNTIKQFKNKKKKNINRMVSSDHPFE
jgi:hypothetical protein